MYQLLGSTRVIEASSFVAAPTAGLYLAQMGASVIRVDQIGGGPDYRRWPKAETGASLYWEGLNKGKKSVALDLGAPEGRELLAALATAPGADAGLFLTNFPVDGFLSHERLAKRRADLVTVRVMGQADGGPALDYTVNCALGIPQITGPDSLGDAPVNHVLPAWDLLTGAYAAFSMLAALLHRRETGMGQEVRIPLADVGIATIANLGQLAETLQTGNRARHGNAVYGAFGRDFLTADGQRLMIMAITPRQWRGLVSVLGLEEAVAGIEASRSVSFAHDEGERFAHRDALFPLVESAVARRNATELRAAMDAQGCCWGPYQDMAQAVRDPVLVADNPLFSAIQQTSGLRYPVPGAMATLPAQMRETPRRARRLGEDSEEILADLLGLGSGQIGALIDRGIAARA
ncbi:MULTISPECIES: CoA transferase [Sphingobium]|jgi:2-methylfumaryl-CoA isomerase|uniref:CoA transferase n=1 Tax=Sphingobium TaxID=165695 RepID=UPI000C40A4A4|nr:MULTISPECIES: CoA transferase [Sphingobium]MBS48999.1 carnitine dehydratase [Sphingobium sp.]MCC4256322.1 CoA transferase [Sphingobium lactosutens]MEE2741370.1 CoA transferase [Pseudomonadota bacterium]HCW61974.1 carnitine dehydratase [Sphingobium sp.]|tara:strand:+ start:448 stop:1662 length:1215 start_codon:yes stop_codon:yes gene_type:complete